MQPTTIRISPFTSARSAYGSLPGLRLACANVKTVTGTAKRGRPILTTVAVHQPASDFLQRSQSLGARGIKIHDLGLDFLHEGSSGPAVEELHCFLLAEGYMPADDTVAHHFYDARTAQAVAAWQRDHGVLATERPGDFGHLSRQAYLSMLEARADAHSRGSAAANNNAAPQSGLAHPSVSITLAPSLPAPMPILLGIAGSILAASLLLWKSRFQQQLLNQDDFHADNVKKEQGQPEDWGQRQLASRASPYQHSSPSMSTRRSPESRQQAASQAPPSPSSMLGGADRSYQQQTAHAGTGQAQEVVVPRSEAAEGPADHLTTYLAAGSAMLIKTAAAKGKPITGLKSKHTAGRELNPVASIPKKASSIGPSRSAAAAAASTAGLLQSHSQAAVPVLDAQSGSKPDGSAFRRPQDAAAEHRKAATAKGGRVVAGSIGGPAGLTAISKPATIPSQHNGRPSVDPVHPSSSATGARDKPSTAAQAANVSLFGSYNPASNSGSEEC